MTRQDLAANLTDTYRATGENLKCDTRLIGSFREEPGIFPGWHMHKAHWLCVALDGTVADEKIKFLVDMRYALIKGRGQASPFSVYY